MDRTLLVIAHPAERRYHYFFPDGKVAVQRDPDVRREQMSRIKGRPIAERVPFTVLSAGSHSCSGPGGPLTYERKVGNPGARGPARSAGGVLHQRRVPRRKARR
jgi:hypothetical protein